MSDPVNSPDHYTWHPSGIQPIEIAEWCSYNIGTAIAYIWRHAHKGQPAQDLRKAAWHLRREAERVRKEGLIEQPDGPRGNFELDHIKGPFSELIQLALSEIWDIGRLDMDEYTYACLKHAAMLCEQESDQLEAAK